MKYAAFAAVLALAACQPAPSEPAKTAPEVSAAPSEPAKPSGPSKVIEAEDDHMPEAWVTDVHQIKNADFKIFSTAGGDPAINGLYTYLAAYTPPEGWTRVYMIGDFNAWEVIEESATRAVLKVNRSWVDEATGDIKTADEKLIVEFPPTPESKVMITPAN